ncbi:MULTISPECIES: DUF5906 domain-containing protein [Pseudomonas aeruginosa group]|uniref:DUF5906 domain-containing protein n=1 Tax=Pseudomonas aeruginosa group TaxID=136841 RepID=UPI0006B2A124|nr:MULTISPECIES: DUF5906 domain-containing protein [Pseudomonas aeruginosa group]KQB31278.1 hypothetical protein AOA77_17575 [Pseudomonas paraeruginosa]MDT1025595.1 DUF5906 domain-containing protein [Pseudomonas paraeruginosa]PHJ32604.1 hypothetical protein CDG78_09120 [Pseudomonas paraeruginosa]QQV47688.1 hypothetical protein JHW37_24200 [Pseudomonas aeruginosa]RQF85722.1 hypothetical protein IPC241_17765 [Pseudomonas aeruginosa]
MTPIEFLNRLRPGGPWCLTAIPPEGGATETRTFKNANDAEAWIAQHNGKRNLYYTVGTVAKPTGKKPTKADIAALEYLWVDVDPFAGEDLQAERARILDMLRDAKPEPSVIVDSGGGFQALWKLSEPLTITDPAEAERYNRELERIFKADSCHNVDRLLRLPGSLNIPNAKKRAKGREAAEAEVYCWNDTSYPLSAFTAAPPINSAAGTKPRAATGKASASVSMGDGTAVGVDELRAWAEANRATIQDHTLALVATGTDPIDPQRYPSRSEALFRAVCDLVRVGLPDELIFGAITDPNNGISASVREQRNWQGYAQRQIENARAACADPTLEEMNKKHAVLLQEGGKTRVLSWERTELDEDRLVPVLQSFEDFRNRYMHRFVEYPTDKGVGYKPLGKWWLEHGQRREYLALRFFPGKPEEVDGYLNMWRGWSVMPKAGDWSLMREHVRRILANGDEACTDYILRWAAWAVQNPGEPAEVALVLRGGRGTGKGIFARSLKRLFGQHGLQVNSPAQLTGRFNAHLRDCCLLFADEAIVPGDKAAESVLKGLITEPELTIEGKGVNLVQARNRLHVVMASNEEWVVPAGIDERRFAVFEVSSQHAQDSDYFRAIAEQLRGGGLAAMLHDLLTMDLGDWHPRRSVPQTEALHAQKAATVGGIDAVFLDLLRTGEIPARRWVGFNQPFLATADLRDYAQTRLRRDDVTLNAVNKLMRDLGFEYHDRSRPRGFVIPSLPDARAAWDRARMPMRWDDLTDWAELGADEYPAAARSKGPF